MMPIGAPGLRVAAPAQGPDGCYEGEMAALQADRVAMNRDMADELRATEANYEAAWRTEKRAWENKMCAYRSDTEAIAANNRNEEEGALASYRTDALALEALNAREQERLRQRIPRVARAPLPIPVPRPHREGVTHVCSAAPPGRGTTRRAQELVAWLCREGIAGMRAGHDAPRGKRLTPHQRAALLLEFEAVPQTRWMQLVPTAARILEAPVRKPAAGIADTWSRRSVAMLRRIFPHYVWLYERFLASKEV